jgi:hypothetical protein
MLQKLKASAAPLCSAQDSDEDSEGELDMTVTKGKNRRKAKRKAKVCLACGKRQPTRRWPPFARFRACLTTEWFTNRNNSSSTQTKEKAA